jgi:membrane fusion protein (multidrug efflux system)
MKPPRRKGAGAGGADCQKAQRYAQLVKDDGVSRQDAEDAKSTCAQDKASVVKKAAQESARINLNWTTVTAPIAGRIGISPSRRAR